MSRLRASQRRLKSELSSHLDDYKRSFSRVLSDAEDSGAEERHNSESKGEGGTLRLLQRGGYTGANTSKSIESLRSVYSSRSIDSFNRRGDNDEDDDDGSSVLMRSLMSPLKPSKPTKASHGTKSAHLDLASSVVILPGTQMLTGMNSSESSSAVNSKATTVPQSYKPRYGSQREGDYEGEDYEENKSSGRLSAKQLDRSGPEKESGMTAVGTRTTSSAISDLTSSGLQSSARSRKLSQTQGSDVMSHVSSDDLSGSSRTRKSTDLSRQTDNTPAERRDSYKAEPSKLLKQSMSVSERSVASRTPTSLSPNNEMNEEDGDESLALSESNDAFPFLEEESIEGSSRSTRK